MSKDLEAISRIEALPEGTKVRIKPEFTKHEPYIKGGKLTFQTPGQCAKDEFIYGIQLPGSVCFMFPATAYEVISKPGVIGQTTRGPNSAPQFGTFEEIFKKEQK